MLITVTWNSSSFSLVLIRFYSVNFVNVVNNVNIGGGIKAPRPLHITFLGGRSPVPPKSLPLVIRGPIRPIRPTIHQFRRTVTKFCLCVSRRARRRQSRRTVCQPSISPQLFDRRRLRRTQTPERRPQDQATYRPLPTTDLRSLSQPVTQ